MQIKSTITCVLTLLAVASARINDNSVDLNAENRNSVDLGNADNKSIDHNGGSLDIQIEPELQQKLQDEQEYGDFSGATEKSFQRLVDANEFSEIGDIHHFSHDSASLDFDALLEEQRAMIEHADIQKNLNRHPAHHPCPSPFPPGACNIGPSSTGCFSDYSSSNCQSASYDCSATGSYGCTVPCPQPCPPSLPVNTGCPIPCPAPCPPEPCALPCPQPCPQPQQFNPCFATPFGNEFCDYNVPSPSGSSFDINDFKFDFCDATAFGVVAQLRLIGLRYPNHPNSAQRTAYINYITGIIKSFPCTRQRGIMVAYLEANPINLNDRKSFNKWAAAFSKNLLSEIDFPLGLNLPGMFAHPRPRHANRRHKRAVRK